MPGQVVFGIVSNGKHWEFGRLCDVNFTKQIKTYVLSDLASLFAALHYVYELVKTPLPPPPADEAASGIALRVKPKQVRFPCPLRSKNDIWRCGQWVATRS